MSKIKIISNPYKKNISYEQWDSIKAEWEPINSANHPNSKLISDEMKTCFFPFKVKTIIDTILNEYSADDEHLEIVFKGTSDEYEDLKEAFQCGEYAESLTISKDKIVLENARDILPQIKKMYQEMSPLISESLDLENIKNNLDRFTDAASDVVPICVLGNYSSGKSTFINALIGGEILPNGADPVTAKIYKISKSLDADRASIICEYKNSELRLDFKNAETNIKGIDGSLVCSLKKELNGTDEDSFSMRINNALNIINDFEADAEESSVSDLIQVVVPFSGGILADSQHPFVIFDTPGSNSASNAKHLKVLKQAMSNMTNGLPIFICTADSLDSTDNDNLYKMILEMEELDNRFTFIVVNKADDASVKENATEEDRKRILKQAVPRNLYSGGIFYVSSVMGLGTKINGNFANDIYGNIYDAQERRFKDPANKYFRSLYKYNIMPDHIKLRSVKEASEIDDEIYANSGLFTIENEIKTFAGKYAAYNKCFQSQMFLKNIIDITEDKIDSKHNEVDEEKKVIEGKLQEDKKKLQEQIKTTTEEYRNEFDGNYSSFMNNFLTLDKIEFNTEELENKEKELLDKHEKELNLDSKEENIGIAFSQAEKDVKQSLHNAIKEPNKIADALKDGFQSGISKIGEAYKERKETQTQIYEMVANEVMKYVKNGYEERFYKISSLIDNESKKYWIENTEKLRRELAHIVTGSEVLDDEQKTDLEELINNFSKLTFKEDKAIYYKNTDYFLKAFRFKDKIILQYSERLDLNRIKNAYNHQIRQNVDAWYNTICASHTNSVHIWIDTLLNKITLNLVSYSPELSKIANMIEQKTKEMDELSNRKFRLENYTHQLDSMMDWQQNL